MTDSDIDLSGCTYENDSAASVARREHARTGQRTNPYAAYPEQEDYEERAVRDGVVVASRHIYRWGSSYSSSAWKPVTLSDRA